MTFVAVSPSAVVEVALASAIAFPETAAWDDGLPINPIPNATTTASEIRLKVVFVDIYFLSLVVQETFSYTADKEKIFVS
jgi:hypothetical protein